MSEDRSLTEFSANDTAAAETEADDSGAIEPAIITYRWRADGTVCSRCGTSTEPQWLDDSEFVCPDCKSWE